eukprot:m.84823 g.84823  ORF g.84823 m.84823 type:complete len:347 (-) comp12762_c0_seq1:190-1230(-)
MSRRSTIGPALPPGVGRSSSNQSEGDSSDSDAYGPAKPTSSLDGTLPCGPSRPPAPTDSVGPTKPTSSPVVDAYGPARPPTIGPAKPSSPTDTYGPARPPTVGPTKPTSSQSAATPASTATYGPARPPAPPAVAIPVVERKDSRSDEDDSSSDDDFGPMPAAHTMSKEEEAAALAREFEERAAAAMQQRSMSNAPKGRESWMTELPERYRKNFDTGPRTFRQSYSGTGGDRSGWTATPHGNTGGAQQEQDAAELLRQHQRQVKAAEVQGEIASFNSKQRAESLMQKHQKKLKKKAQQEGQPPEKKVRRPFSREEDVLGGQKMSAAAKQNMVKKAASFESRFAKSVY